MRAVHDMRVRVLFPGALGDLCLAAPSIAALTSSGAAVELSVRRAVAPIATLLLPNVPLGPPIDGAAMATLFAGAIDPTVLTWLRSADRVLAWLAQSGSAARLAAVMDDLGVAVELHAVPRADADHHVSLAYARAFGLVAVPPSLHAEPPAGTRPLPWRTTTAPRLVVHPGAGAIAKQWSRDGFRAVAAAWTKTNGEVVVLLGPAEAKDLAWWQTTGLPLAIDLPLADAAALVGSATWWIGNDAGMSHVAAALGRRGVVLFGPTRPERWMPLGSPLVPVRFAGRSEAEVVGDVDRVVHANDRATQLDTPRPRH